MLKLGAHMSIAGGVDKAILLGKKLGCEVVQIFTKNSNQWSARPLGEEEIAAFRANRVAFGMPVIAAHGSYLINLCSADSVLYRRSLEAFRHELERCEMLGIPYLIAHPGAHGGAGEKEAIARLTAALEAVFERPAGCSVMVLLEITAGQGSSVGHRFEHLAEIIGRIREPRRLGVCFDTCHAHASGYDMRTEDGYSRTFEEFDRTVGIERIEAFHLNDCKKEVGCRIDRHWHIGRGFLGLEPFRLLMNDPRFDGLPAFLETPKGPDYAEDIRNLRALRRLAGDPVTKRVPRKLRLLPGSRVKAGSLARTASASAPLGAFRAAATSRKDPGALERKRG